MNAQKLVIIGLLVVGLVFCCGLGLGAREPGSFSQPTPPDFLENLLFRPLEPAHLSALCWNPATRRFNFNGVCVGTVAGSEDFVRKVRKMRLHLVQGTLVTAVLVATLNAEEGETITAEETLTSAARDAALDVYEAGGPLTLTCAAGTCVVELR